MSADTGGGAADAFRLARIIRRLKERVRPEELGGESVEGLVRRWSRLRSPELDIQVREHDPAWASAFETEKQRLHAALADEGLVDIQHIGSTSIPPLPGKNILDLAVAVRALPCTARQAELLAGLGYESYGPSPIDPDFTWFWNVNADGQGAFVVHVCGHQSPWFSYLTNFRDFMRAEPEERQRYEALKRELAAVPGQSWLEYSIVKRALALRITERANAWAAARDGAR
ncbi:GrpB family protein [Pyxidicoccus sp. MSG2]|uniref:GrpB family protein n=1 Tax=Pyxidicoccus sp. MSG2 TaxID=2996790 RepID=UPI00226E5343|nr:GrpB family protein [Pyxidicoccus sp. MSG2]MCY1014860.1 GrpB family protein [Pyxidicoccus sp. MSG2]